jgi:hypothetical protein
MRYYLCYFDCYGIHVFYLHVFSCSIFSFYFAVSCVCLSACIFVLFVCLVLPGSFKNMRVITSYTPEDGHIGRNM